MICFASPNRPRAVVLRKMLLESEIFSFHASFPNLENSHGIRDFINALPFKPTIAIIDATESCIFGEEMCQGLKTAFGEIICIALLDKSKQKTIRFKYLTSSDFEIDTFPSSDLSVALLKILTEIGYSLWRSYKFLELGNSNLEAHLLGYPLKLTLSEYRILLYMCQSADETFSPKILLGSCFVESYRMTETNIRTHISSINKKALALCGRRLILSERGKGYRLNEYM